MIIHRMSVPRLLSGAAGIVVLLTCGGAGLGTAAAAGAGRLPANQVPISYLMGIHRIDVTPIAQSLISGHSSVAPTDAERLDASGIPDIDSVPNFDGQFTLAGFSPLGNPNEHWYTNTVGNPPELGGTTRLGAPVFPIAVELMNVDGQGTNLICGARTAARQALSSPVFQNFSYSSSRVPTQWADAIQRASFFREAAPDWHTLLAPQPRRETVIQFPPGTYEYVANPNGSCKVALVDFDTFVDDVFPATPTDTSTPVGAAEHSGAMTTHDITNLILGNVLFYVGSPSDCCAAGFHSYDAEPGDARNGNRQRDFVLTVSNWLDESVLGPTFADASTLTHEISEAVNDPFVASDGVHDITPWWTDPTGVICSDELEGGDVIENMPNQIFPIRIHGMLYHTQTEALLEWFEGVTPSAALGGAFSYPDPTVLTRPLTSLKADCAP
jgi:hypothetical protein